MWLFEDREFCEVPDDIIGFVYLITNEINGKQYIGKKLFTAARTKQVKGKRKRFHEASGYHVPNFSSR